MMAGSGGRRPPLLAEPFQPTLQFLTPEELYQTPESVKGKVLKVLEELNRNFFGSEAQRRNDKAAFEQQLFDLENQLKEKTQGIENLNGQLVSERKQCESYVERYRSVLSQLSASEDKISTLERELSCTKIKSEQVSAEKEDLLTIVEKRNSEIEKLTQDLQNVNEQLQSATIAKIEALAKVDELTSKEIELDYKEKQIEKEKEWTSKQVHLLNEELDKKNLEMIEVTREASSKFFTVQTELSEKTEELRIAEISLEAVKKSNEEQEKHIEKLMEKLREAQDIETNMEENYRQELKSQKKIAELYKESSEDASKKVEELEEAVGNLQALLRQSAEKYNDLEKKFKDMAKTTSDEIHERDKRIEELTQELTDANELLTNIKRQGMTDEMIQSLSPAAAAASAMLKNSSSLTEIYSKYQAKEAELIQAKEDNEKLNNYVNQILKEITDRAPTLRRQKEDYERCLKTVDALQEQLDLSLRQINDSRVENAHLNKSIGALDRENKRLKSQIRDLALQIKSLVKEVETSRGNYSFADPDESSVVPDVSSSPSEMSSSRVITDRLVTFRNIDELQAQNQHLLAVVRELSEAQEKAEKELNENKLQDIRGALEAAKEEIEDLKAVKSRQESMIESLTQQRDTYSLLLKQQRTHGPDLSATSADAVAQEKIASLEKVIADCKVVIDKLKEEHETYRKEMSENHKISSEQYEKLRDENGRLRTDNAKLSSQSEYHNQQVKIFTANMETYKKNINVLEEKYKLAQQMIYKHEMNMETMKTEMNATQQKLARTEVALSSITQERNILLDTKSRLQAERDLYKKEHSTQQMLHINLEEIKNSLEMANSAGRMKLENHVDKLEKDNAALRRKMDAENDRFRETVLTWDKMVKDLQTKLDALSSDKRALEQELESSQGINRTQRKEIEELLSRVSNVPGGGTSVPASPRAASTSGADSQADDRSVDRRVKDLSVQLQDAQTECKSLRQQLELARSSLEEYKSLAQAMEEQLNSANATSRNFSDELSERLACKDDIIRDIQVKLDNVEKENSTLREQKEAEAKESEGRINFINEELSRMRRELQTANSKLMNLTEENCTIKADLEKHLQVSKDMQENYERELALHAQDVQAGGEIKSALDELRNKVDEATRARTQAEELLRASQANWQERETGLTNELEALKQNLQELEALNASLQDQLISVTTQMSSLNRPVEISKEGAEADTTLTADTSMNISFTENDAKSSEQWLKLVRYLRREKEIAKTRAEMAQTTADRLQSKYGHLEQQHQELQKRLQEVQDKSHVAVITSAKQADLLRKVETLSALTDSNRMLREEKETALREIEELKTKLDQVETELAPLKVQNAELESKCEALSTENQSVKHDAARWRARASSLLEKCNKINPDEYKKLQTEKDQLQKQLLALQEQYKKLQQEIARQNLQIKTLQQNLASQQANNASMLSEKKAQLEEQRALTEQVNKAKNDLEASQTENGTLRTSQTEQQNEINRLARELDDTAKKLEEQKTIVKNIKNIAKKYKKQYEDLQVEHTAVLEAKAALEEAAAQAAEASKSFADGSTNTVAEEQQGTSGQGMAGDEVLKQEIAKQEGKVTELSEENEGLRRDVETVKTECAQREERAKIAMKSIREKLQQTNQQKSEIEAELNEYKQKFVSAESSSEEASVRFAALKSQLEARLSKLEKENKELRAAGSNVGGDVAAAGTSEMMVTNANLQEENNRLKKDLEMQRQRVLALEKQVQALHKLHTQQQGSKGTSVGGVDKPQNEPPKANIKPIAGTSSSTMTKQVTQAAASPQSRPLTASIRPMSMQRKATVMPTAAAPMQAPQHSQSNQPQQPSGSGVAPMLFIAPVSQAQVSTSTPDQSSALEHVHHLPVTSSAPTTSVTNSTNVRQATVQPTPAVTVTPVASTMAMTSASVAAPQQGHSVEREPGEIVVHEDPSTSSASHLEDLEMGDSSEQVSSSDVSTHQQLIPVAPMRPQQQDQVEQSSQSVSGTSHVSNQGGNFLEEPSPSTSTTGSRPTQSGKRGRDSEVETSHELAQAVDEPENKRTRVNIPMPVDREAEAMAHQQEEFVVDDDGDDDNDQEADQGHNDDENQIPHSDTGVGKPAASGIAQTESQEDDDSDVVIIDSSDDDDDVQDEIGIGRGHRDDLEGGDEDEDLDEEGEEDEDIGEESEGSMVGTEEEGEVDDDEEDRGHHGMDVEMGDDQDDQDLEHDEGREAESMEEQDGDGDLKIDEGEEQEEADAIVIDEEGFSDSQQGDGGDDIQEVSQQAGSGPSTAGGEERDVVSNVTPVSQSVVAGSSASSSIDASQIQWGQGAGVSARPLSSSSSVSRAGRQDRLPTLGRQRGSGVQLHSQSDDIDDSIVPSTPTLFVPRRSDGFAEAVSSPHVPPQRFIFSSHGDATAPTSQPGLIDDSRIDLHAYDDGTGRSVPSTPLQVSPPAEVAELPSGLDSHSESSRETGGISQESTDVQPSSSDSSRFSQPKTSAEVPTIVITSALVSSLDSSPSDVNLEVEAGGAALSESENPDDAEVHGLQSRPEASVTSSDEDKIDAGMTGQAHQSAATSSSSGTASPTPSSHTSSSQAGQSDNAQHHRVRPTPIVWDQPTSSSSVPAVPTRGTAPRRGTRGLLTGRPIPQPPADPASVAALRGGFRTMRGAQPSARRSRPPTRGPMRGSPFTKGPY